MIEMYLISLKMSLMSFESVWLCERTSLRHRKKETEEGCLRSELAFSGVSFSVNPACINYIRFWQDNRLQAPYTRSSLLLSSVIGEHPVDAYEGQGQERGLCVCVAVSVHSGGQSIYSAGRICCHMQTGEKSAHTTPNRPPQISFWCVRIWGQMCVSHREELLKFKWLWHSAPRAPLLQVLKSWRDKTLQATRGSRLCAVTLYN